MSSSKSLIDKTAVRRGRIKDQGNDFKFWQSKTPQERLAAIEMIRQEYNSWKYDSGQRLQRVYRTIKRA